MNPRTSAKAEAFAAALEGGPAVADPALAALVGLAERLTALPLRPAPDFSAALRSQLVDAAAAPTAPAASTATPTTTAGPSALPGTPGWLTGTAAQLATGALAVAVGVVGTGVGASRSLPGDALYGVKRAVERLQLAFADDAVDQADALAERVRTRLEEISALLEGLSLPLDPRTEALVQDTLDRLRADLDELTGLLLAQARAGSSKAMAALEEFSADARMRLSALAAALPAGALRDSAHAATGQVETAAEEAAEIVATTPPTSGPTTVPTSVPTTPPVTSSPTVPTTPPSSPPVVLPTDVPTDLPTGLPTELPTELPTSLPSPTGVPTLPLPGVSLPL